MQQSGRRAATIAGFGTRMTTGRSTGCDTTSLPVLMPAVQTIFILTVYAENGLGLCLIA
jgi:hypothetical protein